MTIDINQGGAIFSLLDEMSVPQFVVKRLRHAVWSPLPRL
jgi:hypothetical protein